MMAQVKEWLLGLVTAALALTILYALLPRGTVRAVAKTSGALVLLLVLLGPVAGWETGELGLRLSEVSEQLEEQIQRYDAQSQEELARGIEQRCAAYIAEQAAALELSCQARVSTQLRDGIPWPNEVSLDIAWNQALSDCIAGELGIPPERQHWRTDE